MLAAGYGIVALLRSGGEAYPTRAAGRSPAVPSGSSPPNDFETPPKRRMSDASVLALTVVAIVIAVVVGFFVVIWSICSDPHGVVLTALSGFSEFPATGRTGSPRRTASRPQYKEASSSLPRTKLRLRDSTTPR
jgi:hypothetical protein